MASHIIYLSSFAFYESELPACLKHITISYPHNWIVRIHTKLQNALHELSSRKGTAKQSPLEGSRVFVFTKWVVKESLGGDDHHNNKGHSLFWFILASIWFQQVFSLVVHLLMSQARTLCTNVPLLFDVEYRCFNSQLKTFIYSLSLKELAKQFQM